MNAPSEHRVRVNGHECRVLEKGDGPKIGYLAGLIGLPAWTPFLEELSKSHRVVAPSLPGFHGATGADELDGLIDWLSASLDLIEAAGLAGEDLIGASLGGTVAAEIAALSPASVGRLILIAPFGLYDESAPVPHLWARKAGELNAMLCEDAGVVDRLHAIPEGQDPVEWRVMLSRAAAAAARLLWPMCDLGLAKRLHRVRAPTLVLWGDNDKLLNSDIYPDLFANGVSGPAQKLILQSAGHLADLDRPVEAARAVQQFLTKKPARQTA